MRFAAYFRIMISLNKIEKVNVFKVEDNYFEQLTASIKSKIESKGLEKSTTPFSVPNGYFDKLSINIINKVQRLEQKAFKIEDLERVNVFKVPDSYFEGLETFTNFNRLGKENIFKVPNTYFEHLEERTNTVATSPKMIKVNWWNSRKIKWSAAASVILMMGLWLSVLYFGKKNTEIALEKVSNEDIKTYLETQDLSYFEYESSVKSTQMATKDNINQALEGLRVDKQEILEHLETQDLEVDI